MNYVILAAGQGSRFVREGVDTPKPLVEVMGVPMIERLIRELLTCSCESIHIATNAAMPALNDLLHRLRDDEGLPLVIKPIVSDNSFYSLTEACRGVEGRFVAMSVDTIFSTERFREYVAEAERCPDDVVLMGMTRYVDDESPLYARLNGEGTEITSYRYGGEPFGGSPIISAGVYALTDKAVASVSEADSLSDFQRLLAEGSGFKVVPYDLGKAFDVDCTRDQRKANRYLRVEERKRQYRATLKSADTEEHIDLAFYRPIGFAWAVLFSKLRVSPNVVTIISIIFGVAAGVCFYFTAPALTLAGILLLVVANSLDSADGQLARMTRQYSRLGRILDGMAGDLWFLSIYVAIALRTNAHGEWFHLHPACVWVLAAAAGICHARQAAMADYFRQFHLFFVKRSFPAELTDSQTLLRQYRNQSWHRPVQKLIMGAYCLYTRMQERSAPATRRLLKQLRSEYPTGQVPADVASQIRMATLPLCKWENFLTFNWRSITLFASLIAGVPWLYFVAELTVFNAVWIYLTCAHERICARFCGHGR